MSLAFLPFPVILLVLTSATISCFFISIKYLRKNLKLLSLTFGAYSCAGLVTVLFKVNERVAIFGGSSRLVVLIVLFFTIGGISSIIGAYLNVKAIPLERKRLLLFLSIAFALALLLALLGTYFYLKLKGVI